MGNGVADRAARVVGASEAIASIPDGARVFVASGCAVPHALVAALDADRHRWRRIELVTGYLLEPLPVFAGDPGPFTFTSLHPTAALRGIPSDRLRVVPARYSDHPALLGEAERCRPDVALVQVSVPDRRGRCSLGVSVGGVLDALRAARLVIAQANAHMPYTFGDGEISTGDLDLIVPADTPLVELPEPSPTPTARAIADHVAAEVPDGATIQIGVGRLPTAALLALGGHRDLALHGGLLSSGCRWLIERGAVGDRVAIAAEVIGDAALFAWVDRNPAIRLVHSRTSHGPAELHRLPTFVAINSVLEVDHTGAANAEVGEGGAIVSGPGGLPDFVTAALVAPGGRSIVALPSASADGSRPRIVPALTGGHTTLPAFLADRVVTEHGVARLRGVPLGERRSLLAAVAGG